MLPSEYIDPHVHLFFKFTFRERDIGAWLDRHHENTKAATDFDRLPRTYEHVMEPGRLYGLNIDALVRTDFGGPVGAGQPVTGRSIGPVWH